MFNVVPTATEPLSEMSSIPPAFSPTLRLLSMRQRALPETVTLPSFPAPRDAGLPRVGQDSRARDGERAGARVRPD
jgi:hypothetical protein